VRLWSWDLSVFQLKFGTVVSESSNEAGQMDLGITPTASYVSNCLCDSPRQFLNAQR
jgi:hypothetical protein